MNQILSVDGPNKGKKSKTSIHAIVTVFSILLMIFGIGLTTSGAYSYYKNATSKSKGIIETTETSKPHIDTQRVDTSTINITITHDKVIESLKYKVNEEEYTVEGKGRTKIEQEVKLPSGEVKIEIIAKDINGMSSSKSMDYVIEQKPVIRLEQVSSEIKIITESTINIDYVQYYWDEDQENGKKFTINDLKNETSVEVMEGRHTLYIKAVDIEGNEENKTQIFQGVHINEENQVNATKPELNVTTDGEVFIIKATDGNILKKVEITLNSNEMITEEINAKEYSKDIKLVDGENKLIVTVYNENESAVAKVKYTKE